MTGWDFSHLEGRVVTEPLPWDYREKVRDFLKPGVRLLDLGTGGGELLMELGHPFSLTSVTEGWEPNYQLCLSRLAPLGVTVKKYDSEEGLPLPFHRRQLRPGALPPRELRLRGGLRRVLKKDGYFVTQQVGGENEPAPHPLVCSPRSSGSFPGFNLENELPKFRQAGFRVLQSNQVLCGEPVPGRGGGGVPAQRGPLGVPRLLCGPVRGRPVRPGGAGGDPGLCAQTRSNRFLIVAKNRK